MVRNETTKLVSILVVVGIIGGSLYALGTTYLQSQSSTVQVQGEVITSSVDESESRRGGSSYYIDIRYQYVYNDTQYESESVTPGVGEPSMSRQTVTAFVANHSAGDSITVYVNPTEPTQSWVREVGDGWGLWRYVLIPLGGLVILYGRYVKGWTGDRE